MNTTADHDPGADDPRVLELVKEYQAAWERAGPPDRAGFLARFPDLAGVLLEYLDGVDLLHRGARALSGPGGPARRLDTGLAAGDRLGEFELVREVGRGGMGVVFEARQPALNRRVAVKVLPAAFAADRTRLQRFVVEAQAAAAVAHPHIVPVYAVGEDRGVHYYAMRLVDGVPLDVLAGAASTAAEPGTGKPAAASPHHAAAEPDTAAGALAALAGSDRPAYYRAVARLGADVARALDHAHQGGVVHRDVKPANLLIDRSGHVWVTDFGLAQFADGPTVTRTGGAVGTLRYMSPEQAAGDRRRLDHRTDVYSLAVTLPELATGRPAFPADEPAVLARQIAEADPTPPSAADPRFPADLETVLLKAMQKDPADRYATAAELADDLDRFAAGRPVRTRRPSPWDRAKRWVARHPAAVAAALVSLVAVAAAAGVAAVVIAGEQAQTRRAFEASQTAGREAEAARLAADARADEAERRFRRAKSLGDLVLRISEEEMGSDRPFQGPRRKLLLAALENYRGLLEGGHDDPRVRAELDALTARVQTLLAEQDLRWEADAAFLLNFPHVRDELRLTREQVAAVEKAFPPAPPGPPGKGPRGPPDPAPEVKAGLVKALTPAQRQRLREVSVQFRGPRAFTEPEVVEALALTYPQRQQIRSILTEELGEFGRPGPPRPGAGDANARATDRVLDVLTDEQRARWQALRGRPFQPPR